MDIEKIRKELESKAKKDGDRIAARLSKTGTKLLKWLMRKKKMNVTDTITDALLASYEKERVDELK